MKKKIISFAVAVLAFASFAVPVSAHGHHGRAVRTYNSSAVGYSVCGIADCTLTGLHNHNGTSYYAHYYNDGHNYHSYCNIADCAITGYHGHDGTYHFGHTANDGHYYHSSGMRHH